MDETYVMVAGRWRYVYRAVDQTGPVTDVFVSARRDAKAARRFFQRAIGATKVPPAEITTDQARVYPAVLEELPPWIGIMQHSRLLVTADAGGSNSYRSRLWKVELGKLAAETGLAVTVCHFPPGTSKWNRIEHRLFSQISMNWRGRPLVPTR